MGPLIAAVGLSVVLDLYVLTRTTGWADRGIVPVLPWPVVFTGQLGAVAATAPYLTHVWGPGPALAGAAAAWLGVLAVATDLKTCKVPWDVFWPVTLVGLVTFACHYTLEGLLALTACTLGVVGLPLLVRWWTHKGLGMSDVRLLWAITATCSWWVGQTWLLYGLIVACLLQMAVRVAARAFDWGTLVPVHPDRPAAEGEPVALRRELPFAPALVAGLALMVGYGTHTAYGACQMWNILGTC